ncbi:hypothetical protein KFK09_028567 [Dendrobium nobile]|uniref:WRKY domain-containing protein n=1 Tax=Dendrobium nobile TaxID=94219 RepID=A0A8T3A2U2_DENNO|nr:hypothetical protein KFK09_028567 [Dendrobium nobile]
MDITSIGCNEWVLAGVHWSYNPSQILIEPATNTIDDLHQATVPSLIDLLLMGSNNGSSISLDLSIGTLQFSNSCMKQHNKINKLPLIHGSTKMEEKEIYSSQIEAEMLDEMNRVVAENRRLSTMLAAISERHRALRVQVLEMINSTSSSSSTKPAPKKRNCEGSLGYRESVNASYKVNCAKEEVRETRPRISRMYIRSDGLVVRDGYHWRKYGQKVIRDNPYPRAYFRCSFAPVCPVKKKVQRCTEDHSVLVVTYEGEHNHVQPLPGDSLNCLR